MKSAPICYIDHATGEQDHMNAHIQTEQCKQKPRQEAQADPLAAGSEHPPIYPDESGDWAAANRGYERRIREWVAQGVHLQAHHVAYVLRMVDLSRAKVAEQAAQIRTLTAERDAYKRELDAIRSFAESLHSGGCQSPHGGRCSCGWNLIEARLEELGGDAHPDRLAFLRGGVKFVHDEDRQHTEEILAVLAGVASPRSET